MHAHLQFVYPPLLGNLVLQIGILHIGSIHRHSYASFWGQKGHPSEISETFSFLKNSELSFTQGESHSILLHTFAYFRILFT